MENLPFSGNPLNTTTNIKSLTPAKIQAEKQAEEQGKKQGKVEAKKQVSEEELLFALARKDIDKKTVAEIRLTKFANVFVQNGGNATKAAMAAFELKDIYIASSIGQFYAKKVRELGMAYLEGQDLFTLGNLFETMVVKVKTEKDPEYLKMVAKLFGVDQHVIVDKKEDRSVNVNILQDYRKTQEEFGFGDVSEGEIVEEEE